MQDIERRNTRLTTTNILSDVFNVMSTCIGQDNAITSKDLFREIFGDIHDKFKESYLWIKLNYAISLLRKHTNMFIVSDRHDGKVYYYVVKEQREADKYKARCDNMITGFQKMKRKCQEAVDKESWRTIQRKQLN